MTPHSQDWEDFIFIDPNIVGHSTMWLLNYQQADGAFVEVWKAKLTRIFLINDH